MNVARASHPRFDRARHAGETAAPLDWAMTCDRAPQVHAFHDGQLGPVERAAFEAHLAECAACAELLGELRAVSRHISTARLPEMPASSLQHYYQAWVVS